MYYTHLTRRGLLFLSGDDAIPFLQGLISNDAGKLARGEMLYAALLTPQGKYLHDFFLLPYQDGIALDGEKHRLADLRQRLAMYKLRSKVTIGMLPEEEGVVVCWGGEQAGVENGKGRADPRMAALGWRMTGNIADNMAWCAAQGFTQADEEAYDRWRITLGVPDGSRDMTPEKSLLLEFGIDRLNGVDFTKGCYVGQEVTARSKHRAQLRKGLYVVESEAGPLPQAGAGVALGETQAGILCSSAGNLGLALLRIEAAEQGGALVAEGVGLRVKRD